MHSKHGDIEPMIGVNNRTRQRVNKTARQTIYSCENVSF